MENTRNQGNNPAQENSGQKSNSSSQNDPRDTSAKGREEQVVSQVHHTKDSNSSRAQNEKSESCGTGLTSDSNHKNISDTNRNSNQGERSRESADKAGNDRGRQENVSDRNESGKTTDTSAQDQNNISSSNKEKGFREGQQDNQEGLQGDTEIPKIGKEDAEKTQRETPKM